MNWIPKSSLINTIVLGTNYFKRLYSFFDSQSYFSSDNNKQSSNLVNKPLIDTSNTIDKTHKILKFKKNKRNNMNDQKNNSQKPRKITKKRSRYTSRKDPETGNPFLNFLRSLRKSEMANRFNSVTTFVKEAGNMWRNMSNAEKQPFILTARKHRLNKQRKVSVKRLQKKPKQKTGRKKIRSSKK